MSDTRRCERCGGEEFRMRAECGGLIEWRNQSGEAKTWFCDTCDWGNANDHVGADLTQSL